MGEPEPLRGDWLIYEPGIGHEAVYPTLAAAKAAAVAVKGDDDVPVYVVQVMEIV